MIGTMPKAQNKTTASKRSVSDYLQTLDTHQRRQAEALIAVFTEVTKAQPVLWGDSIIGFGNYHYKYGSGREGDFLATGFSIRKSGPTVYIMPGYQDYGKLLQQVGPHKLGKSCLYLKNIDEVHLPTLKKLIRAGLRDLAKIYPVKM